MEDALGRKLEVGDECGGSPWGYKGQIKRCVVKGFTPKKVRVMIHHPAYSGTRYDPTTRTSVPHTYPAREEIGHAFPQDLVKTGVNNG